MVFKIDHRRTTTKATSKKGKGKAKAPASAGKSAGEGRVDRFEKLGRIIGGGGPSSIISVGGPGQRKTAPLTAWEKYDIDHDPYFHEARTRMAAYRNLPDPWKRKVDQWGQKVSSEMKYAIAKELMKKRESKSG